MPRDLFWGKNQSLYRAAPYHVIYNPTTGMHEMIRPWRGSTDHETSHTLVKEALAGELERYPVASIDRNKVKFISLELRTLEQIETVLYPTAFYCSKCRRLYASDPGGTDSSALAAASRLTQKINKGLRCSCGGGLIQWRVLTVHDCGETIHVPTYFAAVCKDHGDRDLYFENHGSERIRHWEIVCKAKGCQVRHGYDVFFRYHENCPLKGSPGLSTEDQNRTLRFETAPIQKATNFIPKVLKLLSSDKLTNLPRPQSKGAAALSLGALRASRYFSNLNIEAGMDAWIDKFDPKGELPDPKLKQLREIVETMKDGEERSRMLGVLSPVQSQKLDILSDGRFQRLLASPGYLTEAALASVYQQRNSTYSISDLLQDPTLHPDTIEQLRGAEAKQKKLKLVSLRHAEDIALTSCLIGYTRGDYDPEKVVLQLYLMNRRGSPLAYTIYTNTVRTEGIFVQLDPTETLSWVGNAIGVPVTTNKDFTSDLFEIQNRFDPSSVRIFKGPEDPWSRTQYGLLHTMSHLMIKALGKFSGLEQEGLTERIYPYQNAFLVYSNQSTEFSLGGLAMAFEHHLNDVLEMMVQDAQTCQYNPECETRYGACPACVYLAEISCENFNRVLDRRRLAPSRADSFWR